jgi:uncharacterized protein YjiS (DUF1127 family)
VTVVVPMDMPPRAAAGDVRPAPARLSAIGIAAAVLRILWIWSQRSRQRAELSSLDDRLLRDIGLSRYDAEWEARKPFWRP